MRVGFVGLGAMGAPMAANLARAGCLHAVWNRTPGKARAFADEHGVRNAASPAELTRQVDVVLVCVSADADVTEVIDALLPAVGEQTVVVDHSTVSRETAQQAADSIRARGGDFIDAPVTGGVEGARLATLVVMAGGRTPTLTKVTPVLQQLSRRIVHMGEVGSGQAAKAVNQVMAAGIAEAVCEALAFGVALNLDMDKVIEIASGGAAGNWFLDRRGKTMVAGSFQPGFKLALHRKDLEICSRMARDIGFLLPLADQTRADYARLIEAGHGEDDISALYRLKRPA
jgi:3-hydroxyisobutyrate dehydrogenase